MRDIFVFFDCSPLKLGTDSTVSAILYDSVLGIHCFDYSERLEVVHIEIVRSRWQQLKERIRLFNIENAFIVLFRQTLSQLDHPQSNQNEKNVLQASPSNVMEYIECNFTSLIIHLFKTEKHWSVSPCLAEISSCFTVLSARSSLCADVAWVMKNRMLCKSNTTFKTAFSILGNVVEMRVFY